MTLPLWALAGSRGNAERWYVSSVKVAETVNKAYFILLLTDESPEGTDTRSSL